MARIIFNAQAGNHMFKVNYRNTNKVRNMFIVNKKTPERHHSHCSDVFIVNFERFHTLF